MAWWVGKEGSGVQWLGGDDVKILYNTLKPVLHPTNRLPKSSSPFYKSADGEAWKASIRKSCEYGKIW